MAKDEFSVTLKWLKMVVQYNKNNSSDITDNLKALYEVTKDTDLKDIEAYSFMLLKLTESLNEGLERINKAIDFYREEFKKGNIKTK